MKKAFFLPVMALLTSCGAGTDASLSQSFGSYALFMFIGFIAGAFLGFCFARMPNYDYTEPNPGWKKLISCMLAGGFLLSGIGAMMAYLYIMDILII